MHMLIVGTRPEIIKTAPIIHAFEKAKTPFAFINCGQHGDYNMSQQFIEQLDLPSPDYTFKVNTHSPIPQITHILTFVEHAIKKVQPTSVLVEGDTNTVLASALVSIKLNIPVIHVEAGLRSFDLRMPEEHNRRLVDHISQYLFAPTENAKANLVKENVWGKIHVTGNTAIDAVMRYLPLALKKSTMNEIRSNKFILATEHRMENVDNPTILKNFVEALEDAPLPVVYPVHPRTQKRLQHFPKKPKNIQFLQPLGYFDFLVLMKNCEMIVTDSGGIQEEATAPAIRKFVIVTRTSTERPEAVKSGFAKVVGLKKQSIVDAMKEEHKLPRTPSPFGDGHAAERIVNILNTCE